MNKRGQEEPTGVNLIKLIIAAIGIVILLIIIGIILKTYFENITVEKAASSLDYILRETQDVPAGGNKTITLTTPRGWYLVYFEKSENINPGGFEKPDTLFSKSVACVCKDSKCDPKACKEFETPLKKDGYSLVLKINIMDIEIFNKLQYYDFKIK